MEIVNFSFEYLVEDLCTYDGSFFVVKRGITRNVGKTLYCERIPFSSLFQELSYCERDNKNQPIFEMSFPSNMLKKMNASKPQAAILRIT